MWYFLAHCRKSRNEFSFSVNLSVLMIGCFKPIEEWHSPFKSLSLFSLGERAKTVWLHKITDKMPLSHLHWFFWGGVVNAMYLTQATLCGCCLISLTCLLRVTCLPPEAVLLNRMFDVKNLIALHTPLVLPQSLRWAETVSPQAAFGTSTENPLKENGWNCLHHVLHWSTEISVSKDNCFSRCSYFFLHSPHLF